MSILAAGGEVAYRTLNFIKWGSAIVGKFIFKTYDVWHGWWGAKIGWSLITGFFFVLVDVILSCVFLDFYIRGYVF